MKVIHLARFCLIDQGPEAESLMRDLERLPIGAAHLVDPGEQALEQAQKTFPDIIVVNGLKHKGATERNALDMLREKNDDGSLNSGTECPVILLLKMPRRIDIYAAVEAGYAAVMPLPTNSRLLYRRTAALLQKERRSQK